MPDGSLLIVEMGPDRGWVARVPPHGGTPAVIARTGRPNGLARDRNGLIWVAETAQRAVLAVTDEGTVQRIADRCGDTRFMFLNDLAFAPNGDLYVTDSGVEMDAFAPGGELNPDFLDLEYDGRVIRVDAATRAAEFVDRGIRFTNGLAFGPDGHLYVAETLNGMIHRYRCRDGRVVGGREPFGNVLDPDGLTGLAGPDGMKFAADGCLYVAVFGQGHVAVMDPSGRVVERKPVEGIYPTNLAFGAPGERRIYVTEAELGTIQVLETRADGFELYG
jgi:gluconolactonase